VEVSEHDRAQHARQRRFLVVISMVLLAKYALAIEFGDKLQLLGMDFDIQRKEVLVVAGWIMWAWALIRLSQYHRAVAREDITRAKGFETHLWARQILIRDQQKKLDAGISMDGVRLEGDVIDIRYGQNSKRQPPGMRRDSLADYTVEPDGGRRYFDAEVIVRTKAGGETGFGIDAVLTGEQMRRARYWVFLRCLVRAHGFSDYYAPFFIAALPVFAAVLHFAGRMP
jgi:hypothetical protein